MEWSAKIINHHNKNRIAVFFPKDPILIDRIKKLAGAQWSQTKKLWHLPYCNEYLIRFGLYDKLDTSKSAINISTNNHLELKKFIEMLQLKGYSQNTIRTYQNEFVQFLVILKEHDVEKIEPEKIKSYILYCINDLKLTENTIHSRLNAIKFYFEKVLHKERFMFDIPRPKKHQILPKAIHKIDLTKVFEETTNLKHKMILKLSYGMGLRVSEIVNLKIEDIDSNNMQVHIVRGKGKKDRYTNLPESILIDLRAYYKLYKPTEYLFEGQYGGKYSTRSAQIIFKNALTKAGINKKASFHSLRHSYATHLLESGVDISLIKDLLGHNDIKTTLIYLKISTKDLQKIKSPLDDM